MWRCESRPFADGVGLHVGEMMNVIRHLSLTCEIHREAACGVPAIRSWVHAAAIS